MTQLLAAKKYNMLANPSSANMGDWQGRHNAAVSNPAPNSFEEAVVRMLTGWLEYADIHKSRYEDVIGNDGVLGVEWGALGRAIHGLLNGTTDRLDCGTLSMLIHTAMMSNGVEDEW